MSFFSNKPADNLNASDEATQDPIVSQQELNSGQAEDREAAPSKPSIISEGFEFVGTITTSGTLNIAGVIRGKITAKSVLIDTSGQVEGEVHSDQVFIKGSLHGEVDCFDLNIGPRADIDGSVSYQNIHIQRGGRVKGQFTKK